MREIGVAKSNGRVLLTAAAALTLALAVSLAAGEAYVRRRERSRSTAPGRMPLLFYRHVRLRHALVRDYSYFLLPPAASRPQ